MRSARHGMLRIALCVVLTATAPIAAWAERRVALVIGTSNYSVFPDPENLR